MTEEYTYTVSSRFETFLSTFHERGIPDKFTNDTLKEAGYKSTNDRRIKDVLQFIGFLDQSMIPTKMYLDFRDKSKQKSVMASALKTAYQGLFVAFPNAHTLDRAALENFFSTKTTAGKQIYAAMARTFETLCKFADFNTPSNSQPTPAPAVQSSISSKIGVSDEITPQININIQFVLPADKDPQVYDAIFKSLSKHLLRWKNE